MSALDHRLVAADVGRRIAELRAERGWTQEQFAEQADVSVRYLQQVEAGSENLTLESLVTFANLMRLAGLHELFERPKSRKVTRGRPPRTAVRRGR